MPTDCALRYSDKTMNLSGNFPQRSKTNGYSEGFTIQNLECGDIPLIDGSNRLPEIRQRPGLDSSEFTKREDKNSWSLAEYRRHLREVENYIVKRERYSRQLVDTHMRNQELISNVKRSIQQDKIDSDKKMAQLTSITRESEGYAHQLKYYSDIIPAAEDRLLTEERLNSDWKMQKKRFEGKLSYQSKMQTSEGLDQDTVDAYKAAKRLYDKEQGRRSRLQKKDAWYEKELAAIKSVAKQHGIGDHLPEIKAKSCGLSENGESLNRIVSPDNGCSLPNINTNNNRHNLIQRGQIEIEGKDYVSAATAERNFSHHHRVSAAHKSLLSITRKPF